jgi:hypothetical protein
VHSTSHHLYGHIVATNPFGEAYMIPALDTFENMRECLGATSVTLPTASDLRVAYVSQSNSTEDEVAAVWRKANPISSRPPTPPESTPDFRHLNSDREIPLADPTLRDPRARFWNPTFATERRINDRPFIECHRSMFHNLDVLDTFLDLSSSSTPSFELQSVKNFCVVNSTNETEERAWYWHAPPYGNEDDLPRWGSVSDLGHKLREKVS